MRVCVIGAGIAGTLLAWRLSGYQGVSVDLVTGLPGADATPWGACCPYGGCWGRVCGVPLFRLPRPILNPATSSNVPGPGDSRAGPRGQGPALRPSCDIP